MLVNFSNNTLCTADATPALGAMWRPSCRTVSSHTPESPAHPPGRRQAGKRHIFNANSKRGEGPACVRLCALRRLRCGCVRAATGCVAASCARAARHRTVAALLHKLPLHHQLASRPQACPTHERWPWSTRRRCMARGAAQVQPTTPTPLPQPTTPCHAPRPYTHASSVCTGRPRRASPPPRPPRRCGAGWGQWRGCEARPGDAD